MSTEPPPTYSDLIRLVEAIPLLTLETRRRRGLSLRPAADEIGISGSTLLRIESGKAYNARVLPALIAWIAK